MSNTGIELSISADAARAAGLDADDMNSEVTKVPADEPSADEPSAVSRVQLAAEALGYAGGVLTIAAAIYLARELWRDIPTGAELAFAAVACVALGAAGAALRAPSGPAVRRLRSVLWLMSTASLAAFTGVLADQVWKLSPASTTLVTAGTVTAYGVVQWLHTRAVLQHLTVFASAAVLVGTAVVQLRPAHHAGAGRPGARRRHGHGRPRGRRAAPRGLAGRAGCGGRFAGGAADCDPVPADVGGGGAGDLRGWRGPGRFRGLAGEAAGRCPVSRGTTNRVPHQPAPDRSLRRSTGREPGRRPEGKAS
jgi:hypothetical protein